MSDTVNNLMIQHLKPTLVYLSFEGEGTYIALPSIQGFGMEEGQCYIKVMDAEPAPIDQPLEYLLSCYNLIPPYVAPVKSPDIEL